jgi:phospholipid/cholesterol/gamma-HCH transport system substrate-binding protein
MFSAVNRVAAATEQAIDRLQPLAQALGDPKLRRRHQGLDADTHDLLDALVHGDGTLHRFFFDRHEADRLDELLAHLSETSARLDGRARRRARRDDPYPPGAGHPARDRLRRRDLEGRRRVGGRASQRPASDSRGQRSGPRRGLRGRLFPARDGQPQRDERRSARDRRRRASGAGTIGGLLVDPTVYEDIKGLVGNVERNEVLRALVRYSIKADEQKPEVRVKPSP